MFVSAAMIAKEDIAAGFIIAIPVTAFLLWIYFGTYYEFRNEYLYCRSGPFFEKIPYDKIKSVKLCENMLSSMALSSKRLEISQHGKGYITGTTMISPVNRDDFLSELKKRCRYLE
jgi:uncharacterized membrane protein YobD (UPF0266 family)